MNRFSGTFLKNERAADALPMRMVVAVIAIGALLLLMSGTVSSLIESEQTYTTKTIISEIESNAEQMSAKGSGSIVTLDVNVPSGVEIIFGALPENEDAWPSDADNYYIEINGKQIIGESSASYSNSTLNDSFILNPGSHILTLESVRDQNGKIFIALSDKSQP
ncbi:hypothetical protein SAMN04488589_1491 [Methanolobus vulcani]|jgi:hypothetical protein|uniref:Uncharacterized protein n=1 Tax=Methanolobus vulcani TaxID=38026 RepID=A0A7Z7AZ04_9EURY|nr:hypothetical protein [Methanolobus vulcani]MDK2826283.1 hypothetical protein [Methanolobus sp.]MDK2948121.1 hypothetical protein [Methanolobus sp.]SDF84243.1 hypothetical protein SAMN04488589_1491 [Methanolobus vulcani]